MPKKKKTVKEDSPLEIILDHEIPSRAEKLCVQYVEACEYTTTALHGISLYLSEAGDEDGADLISKFVREFAKHEAKKI